MSVPVSQMYTVASYVIKQKLSGRKRYPLVLMLEPLFRCNLACAGCGKIQYPAQILKKHLTVEQCLKAVDECGAPIVSIPGGEPLMYPDIDKLVTELVKRKKYIYLCTNAILLQGEARPLHAVQVPHVQRPHGRTARGPRRGRLPRRGVRRGGGGDQGGARARVPRHDQHHAVRRRLAAPDARSSSTR